MEKEPPPYTPLDTFEMKNRSRYNIIKDNDGLYYSTSDYRIHKYRQPDDKIPEEIKTFNDAIIPLDKYPWDVKSTLKDIHKISIESKGQDFVVSKNRIMSSKPFLLGVINDILYIWTPEYREHRILKTDGSSIVTGYDVIDYNGKSITLDRKYTFMEWETGDMLIDTVRIKGEENIINLQKDVLSKYPQINVDNQNNLNIHEHSFETLTISATYGEIKFNGSSATKLNAIIEGSCIIGDLSVDKVATVKIVGPGELRIKTKLMTKIDKNIFGTGKVVITQ